MDRVLTDLALELSEGINPVLPRTRVDIDKKECKDLSALEKARKVAMEATEVVRSGSPIE